MPETIDVLLKQLVVMALIKRYKAQYVIKPLFTPYKDCVPKNRRRRGDY